ncbi:MAG: ABC transporter substrate-binding protein [Halobacteria archaeon]
MTGDTGDGRRRFLKLMALTAGGVSAGCLSEGDGGRAGNGSGNGTGAKKGTGTGSKPRVSGIYRYGSSSGAKTLNPIHINDATSAARVGLTMDGTYTFDNDFEVVHRWVKSIDTDDERVYEFEFRDNLEWSEPYGEMTAEDWIYSIKNVFQGKDNWAAYVNRDSWYVDGEPISVEKKNKRTVEISLPDKDPFFPKKPVMWGATILPKGLLEKYVEAKDTEGLKKDQEIQTLAYTGNLGPYSFEEWKRESKFVTDRNSEYYLRDVEGYEGTPYFEKYVYKLLQEQSTRLSALRTGEITATGIPASQVESFKRNREIDVIEKPTPYITDLIYNQRANGWKPFRKKSVRRALSYAVDKKNIARNVYHGYANVAHTFQPKYSEWYNADEVENSGVGESYSRKKAKTKLEDALPKEYGYSGDKLMNPEGEQVSLKLVWSRGTQTTKTTAQVIKKEYGKIGIDVKLVGTQGNTVLRKYAQTSMDGKTTFNAGPRDEAVSEESWDMMYALRLNTYPLTPTATKSFWLKDGSANFYGYHPETDLKKLYDEAENASDNEKRKKLLGKVFGVLSKEQPVNFIQFNVETPGFRTKVRGKNPGWSMGYDQQNWYFATE